DVRQIRLDLHFKTAGRRVETFAHGLDRGVNDLPGRQWPEVKSVLSSFHPGEGEKVFYQAAEALVFLGDELEILAGRLFFQLVGVQQCVHEHPHRGQRSNCQELLSPVSWPGAFLTVRAPTRCDWTLRI